MARVRNLRHFHIYKLGTESGYGNAALSKSHAQHLGAKKQLSLIPVALRPRL